MDQTLTKIVIDEDHPVIEGILNSQKLDDETKLLALAEIDHLNNSDKMWRDGEYADDVDELFEWKDSDLGVNFWSEIQDKVFKAEKRSC